MNKKSKAQSLTVCKELNTVNHHVYLETILASDELAP